MSVRNWRTAIVGLICLTALLVSVALSAAAAVDHYGLILGILVTWLVGPFVGLACTMVAFLWLMPMLFVPSSRRARPAPSPRTRHGHEDGARAAISVIMPVYNGRRFLERSLPPLVGLLRDQEIMELIVVDDGSTDGSADYAAACGASVMPSGGRLGPAAARNLAALISKGDVLWFVDADVVVYPAGPAHIRDGLGREGVVAVFGSYDDNPPELNFGSQYKNLLHHHHHQNPSEEASTFWSGCGAVSREAFLAIGGFDSDQFAKPSIEDVELGYRLCAAGWRIVTDPRFLCVHLKHWSVPELVRVDILRRAIPWSRLIIERGELLNELNISTTERLRSILAATLLVAAGGSTLFLPLLWAVPFLVLTAVTTNWPLIDLFYRRRGLRFTIIGIAFHQLYYLYSTFAFLLCWAEAKLRPDRKARLALAHREADTAGSMGIRSPSR